MGEGRYWPIAKLRRLAALSLIFAFTLYAFRPSAPAAAEEPRVRVGTLKGGTLSWELFAMKELGIDRKEGFVLEAVDLAGKAAGEIAFLGGSVDVIVDDWLWVARQRARGLDITGIYPYLTNSAGVIVPIGSPIKSIGDLKGKKIGIPNLAGKGWMVLRLACVNRAGFDPQTGSKVITSSPNLLSAFLEKGDLDAIIQFWQHVPPLLARGEFKELVRISDLLKDLVGTRDISFGAYVVHGSFLKEHPETVKGFVRAVRATREYMKENDDIWPRIWEHTGWQDHSHLPLLRDMWRSGLPKPWTHEAVKSMEELFRKMAQIGDEDLLGTSAMPVGTFSLISEERGP